MLGCEVTWGELLWLVATVACPVMSFDVLVTSFVFFFQDIPMCLLGARKGYLIFLLNKFGARKGYLIPVFSRTFRHFDRILRVI